MAIGVRLSLIFTRLGRRVRHSLCRLLNFVQLSGFVNDFDFDGLHTSNGFEANGLFVIWVIVDVALEMIENRLRAQPIDTDLHDLPENRIDGGECTVRRGEICRKTHL